MPRRSLPIIFTLAGVSLLTISHRLISAPPAAVPKGPDWGSDAFPDHPPTTAVPVIRPATGPAQGSGEIARPPVAAAPAAGITPTPTAIHYDNHAPAAISERSLLAVFGNDAWNLKTMSRFGEGFNFPKTQDNLTTVMSADGKFVAVAPFYGRRDATTTDVTVYDTSTGAKVSDVLSALREDSLDYVGLAKAPWMLIASRGSPIGEAPMELWNFQTGKIIRRFNCCYWEPYGVALSPDGKFVAISNTETTKIYNIETSEVVATMDVPARDIRMGVHVDSNGETMQVRRVAMSTLTIASLAFSPDGTELAALASVFDRDEARLICWDAKGKIRDDFVFDSSRGLTPGEPGMLQWSPDGKAFMVKGRWLIDRRFQHLVFNCQGQWSEDRIGAFIDPAHYFAVHRDNHGATLDLPLDTIRKSIAVASDRNAPAILRPGQAVSLQLTMENAGNDGESVRKMIVDSVTARLKRDGISVAENQKTVLAVTFTETPGATADETIGALNYEIDSRDKGGKETIPFTDHIDEHSSVQKGSTAAQNRRDFLGGIELRISGMKLPYFIPAKSGLDMLPIEAGPGEPE